MENYFYAIDSQTEKQKSLLIIRLLPRLKSCYKSSQVISI